MLFALSPLRSFAVALRHFERAEVLWETYALAAVFGCDDNFTLSCLSKRSGKNSEKQANLVFYPRAFDMYGHRDIAVVNPRAQRWALIAVRLQLAYLHKKRP